MAFLILGIVLAVIFNICAYRREWYYELGVYCSIIISFAIVFFTFLILTILFQYQILNKNDGIQESQYNIELSSRVEYVKLLEDGIDIKINDSSDLFTSLAKNGLYGYQNTFFIPWDKDYSQLFLVLQDSDPAICLGGIHKRYIYMPQDSYDKFYDNEYTLKEKFLDATYIDVEKALVNKDNISEDASVYKDKSSIKSMPPTETNSKTPDKEDSITDSPTNNSIIESKLFFRYDYDGKEYIIRCNDGSILTINKDVVTLEDNNDSVKYVDKILQVVTDINGNDVSFYKYVIYE